MARYKLRRVGFVATSLPLILAVTSCQQSPTPNPPPPPVHHPVVKGDSPAEVVGGSLFLKWKNGYAPDQSCKEAQKKICGHSDGVATLDLQNLGSLPAGADPANGWELRIQDPKKSDVLTICSDPKCSITAWVDPTKYYVQVRADESEDNSTTNEKHFHNDKDCPGGKEDRKCDRAIAFSFNIGGVSYNPSGMLSCDGSSDPKDRCIVFIGTRPIN